MYQKANLTGLNKVTYLGRIGGLIKLECIITIDPNLNCTKIHDWNFANIFRYVR